MCNYYTATSNYILLNKLPSLPWSHQLTTQPPLGMVVRQVGPKVDITTPRGVVMSTFECVFEGCGRVFSRQAHLDDHITTHTGKTLEFLAPVSQPF